MRTGCCGQRIIWSRAGGVTGENCVINRCTICLRHQVNNDSISVAGYVQDTSDMSLADMRSQSR